MTIIDKPFAAELVNTKGKAYKFDAIECMAAYLAGKEETEFVFQLVKDFNLPEDWIDAKSAYFLISNQLPSPMGAYLSAYKDKSAAESMQQQKGGAVYNWTEVKKVLGE
jgi:copper chaperone NosL